MRRLLIEMCHSFLSALLIWLLSTSGLFCLFPADSRMIPFQTDLVFGNDPQVGGLYCFQFTTYMVRLVSAGILHPCAWDGSKTMGNTPAGAGSFETILFPISYWKPGTIETTLCSSFYDKAPCHHMTFPLFEQFHALCIFSIIFPDCTKSYAGAGRR